MFKTEYKVVISDINYGGHMGNQIPLVLFHQARLEFLKSHGLYELNIGDNVGTLQRESWVKYNREIFFGEKLILEIKNIEIEKLIAVFTFNVINEKNECAIEGTTTMIGYNHEIKKVARIPESFKNLVEKLKA
ncbi:MAG: acyl-CoA thioesterase [Fusobacteriaceae bacterium]